MPRDASIQISNLHVDIDILARRARVTARSGSIRVPRVVLNVAIASALEDVEGLTLHITRISGDEAHLAGVLHPRLALADHGTDWTRFALPDRLPLAATCGLTPTRRGGVSIELRELSSGKWTRVLGPFLARLAPFIRKNIRSTPGVRRGAGARSLLVLDLAHLLLVALELDIALKLPPVTGVTGDGDGLIVSFGEE